MIIQIYREGTCRGFEPSYFRKADHGKNTLL